MDVRDASFVAGRAQCDTVDRKASTSQAPGVRGGAAAAAACSCRGGVRCKWDACKWEWGGYRQRKRYAGRLALPHRAVQEAWACTYRLGAPVRAADARGVRPLVTRRPLRCNESARPFGGHARHHHKPTGDTESRVRRDLDGARPLTASSTPSVDSAASR